MTRRSLLMTILLVLAALLLAPAALVLFGPTVTRAADCEVGIQPEPSPVLCVGGDGPATATPTPYAPDQHQSPPCPPYTDFEQHFADGTAICSTSDGRTLTYTDTTGRWVLTYDMPDTAMEAPR